MSTSRFLKNITAQSKTAHTIQMPYARGAQRLAAIARRQAEAAPQKQAA